MLEIHATSRGKITVSNRWRAAAASLARTEPARIGQAHNMCAELQIEVIVFLRWHMVR